MPGRGSQGRWQRVAGAVQPPAVSDPSVLHGPAKGGKGATGKIIPAEGRPRCPSGKPGRPVAWMAGQAVIKDSPTLQR